MDEDTDGELPASISPLSPIMANLLKVHNTTDRQRVDRMSDQGRILGTTKVTDRWRISLIKAVREELAAEGQDVEIGDRVVFRARNGEIVIEPA